MGLYKINKKEKVGNNIECPVCHKKFKKIQYSQAFCCIQCKDNFHNHNNKDRHKYHDDISDDEDYLNNEADFDQWGDCEIGIE